MMDAVNDSTSMGVWETETATATVTSEHDGFTISSELSTVEPASYVYVFKRDWLQNVCYWYNYTMYIVIIGALCACGLVGNTLVRLALWTDRTKSATVFLLICLSIVDDLVLIVYGFMLMAYMISYVDSVRGTQFPEIYQAYFWNWGWAVSSTLQVTATWMLLVISIQRYIGVCHPITSNIFNTVRSASFTVFCVVLASVAYNFPRFFKYERVTNPATGREYNAVTNFAKSESYRVTYELICYYILVYVLPMIVLIYTTTKLLLALRQSKERRAQMVTNSQNTVTSKLQDEVTRSVVGVVVLFFISQLANPTRRIIDEILPESQKQCGTFYYFYAPLSGVSIIFNSAINFVVFCVCARGFRRQLMDKLRRSRKVQDSSTASSSTRRFGTSRGGTRVTALPPNSLLTLPPKITVKPTNH